MCIPDKILTNLLQICEKFIDIFQHQNISYIYAVVVQLILFNLMTLVKEYVLICQVYMYLHIYVYVCVCVCAFIAMKPYIKGQY